MKYAVQVIADSSGQWCGNGLIFNSRAEADAYGAHLAMVWTAVRDWRIIEKEAADGAEHPAGD